MLSNNTGAGTIGTPPSRFLKKKYAGKTFEEEKNTFRKIVVTFGQITNGWEFENCNYKILLMPLTLQ